MNSEIKYLIYKTPQEVVSVNAVVKGETIWLTQKAMAELFNCSTDNISLHLKNIFAEGKLEKIQLPRKSRQLHNVIRQTQNDVTISKMETVINRGFKGKLKEEIEYYNLDAIIAVGYRVNSKEATRFRMWATDTLKEYIVKGFVLNDDMLKNGRQFGKDYFDELLARIKEIRASERRFYQKITDIFAQCSYDYDKDSIEAKQFYATVQNKLHWAITNKTAAEIIADRADHNKPHMGLTTWKTAPDGKIISTDVVIAKNYLLQEEISELNNIVSMFLDYAENQARRKNLMMMDDWSYRLDSFLQFNEYDILSNAGKISKKVADNLAKEEFKKYRIIQDREFKSDFDKLTASTMKKK